MSALFCIITIIINIRITITIITTIIIITIIIIVVVVATIIIITIIIRPVAILAASFVSGAMSGQEDSKAKSKRDREYQKDMVSATMLANPLSQCASVWKALRGKSRGMQALQDEFMKDFKAKGFGMVEGSKWTTFVQTQEFEDEGEYMTEAQIEREECGDKVATKAKLDYARSQGEGIAQHGRGKGYFRDPSRNNQFVYRYDKNIKDRLKIARTDGRKTCNFNQPMHVGDLQTAPSSRSTSPLPLQDLESPRGSELDNRPPAAASPAPIQDGAGSNDVDEATMPELIKKAEDLLITTNGMDIMEGFRKELELALAHVKKVKGLLRSNYRVAEQLKRVVDLTTKVLNIMEEST